jgi:PKD repeat protein
MLVILSFVLTSCLSTMFDQAPVAKITITAGNPYGSAPLEMTFDISGSFDPDGEIVSFTFNFGDGSEPIAGADLAQPITHTFTASGQYFVTLTVVDNVGKKALTQLMIVVTEPPE